MNCKQCGHMLNNNQTFCPNCGTKVEQGQMVNNMYQQNMNNMQQNQYQNMNYQINNQYQNNKKVRYHWEYGCLCFVAFWIPYFILFFLSFVSGDASIKDSTLFNAFQAICTILGLCTIPAFIISAIVYSIKVKK